MDALQKLIDAEAIRTLIARRVRCIDEKDWNGFADTYAYDAVSWSVASPDGPGVPTVGNRLIADRVAELLKAMTTVHQIHLPEIEVTAPDAASAIIPLEDLLFWEHDGVQHWMHGFGHYRQTFAKRDGHWKITEHRLTRLRFESGTGPLTRT
jgi:SnoaL-like domain